MRYNLNQANWKLKALDPYVPLMGKSMELGQELRGITPWIDCGVPGGVALAAYRAGLIEYPYFEQNSLKCEWLENRWWIYQAVISKPELKGTKYTLFFHGVDYDCMVYLNGTFLGEHKGMYESFSFDITEEFRKSDTLTIKVLIRHAPDEMGQIGKTSLTFTQKSRFNYKWDFSTRLVNLGIWQDVEIVAENEYALGDVSLTSDVAENGTGLIFLSGDVVKNCPESASLTVSVICRLENTDLLKKEFPVEEGNYTDVLRIENPELWYPNGYGRQPLYDVILVLKSDFAEYDRKEYKQGLRRLRYLQNEDAPKGALPYTFEVNGEKIYIKGVNMTPLDHIYGDLSWERYEATLRAAANMNVNLIRVWGGGIIEKEMFYRLCDQYGIMLWQELIQSSSGLDNIPSKRPEFLQLLSQTAHCAVKKRRNHTSLTVWSGGNELMDQDGVPSTYEDENIRILKQIVNELDPSRMFLPTSASGPSEWQTDQPGTSHDVHGDWTYRGNPRHYETYSKNDNLFHSEFGCDGMSGMRTIPKIFSEKHRKPVSMEQDDVWRFHGDWWCTYGRDTQLYGRMDSLPEYIAASQWTQAEGIRYILEANRRRQFHNSGSIIWQFNEPWPNVSCTCLYTYFDEPKMAYYWAQEAFSAYHVSLDYRRLDYMPDSEFQADVWMSTDWTVKETSAAVRCEALRMNGEVIFTQTHTCDIIPNRSTKCFPVSFRIPEIKGELFVLRVTAESGSYRDETCYFFSAAETELYAPARGLPKACLKVTLSEDSETEKAYLVKNVGNTAALHVHAFEAEDRFNILADCNFFTLFPGESRKVNIRVFSKFPYGFDEYRNSTPPCTPNIQFAAFPEE